MICAALVLQAGQLVKAVVYTRHGARTPFFVTDPGHAFSCSRVLGVGGHGVVQDLGADLRHDCRYGQLTDVGYEQHRELAGLWRERYGGLLGEGCCYFRTTQFQRTELSLYAQLHGLGGGVHDVHVREAAAETMASRDDCPYVTALRDRLMRAHDPGDTVGWQLRNATGLNHSVLEFDDTFQQLVFNRIQPTGGEVTTELVA